MIVGAREQTRATQVLRIFSAFLPTKSLPLARRIWRYLNVYPSIYGISERESILLGTSWAHFLLFLQNRAEDCLSTGIRMHETCK